MAVLLVNRTTPLVGGGTTSNTPVGYCHDLTLIVHADGSLTPNNVVLGNKGDLNITRVTFDVTELEMAQVIDPLSDYISAVIVYNPTEERSENNPKTYEIDGPSWIVPEEVSTNAVQYRCLFTLTEREPPHTTPETEKWVSNEFISVVNDTYWDQYVEAALEHPIIYQDTYGYLVKPPIVLTPSEDHYQLLANDTNLGEKRDIFVKRVEFNEDLEKQLDEGFVYKYGVFISGEDVYVVKFNEVAAGKYACLVPKEITGIEGKVDFLGIVTTEQVEDNPDVDDDGFKRWVSNNLQFEVSNNFLESDLPTWIQFVLSDDSELRTSRDFRFAVEDREDG